MSVRDDAAIEAATAKGPRSRATVSAFVEPASITTTDPLPAGDGAFLCVLASGSSGNCSALVTRRGPMTRVCLIDLGLSPRRTFRRLAESGLRPDQIDHAVLTHLDTDHFHPGWSAGFPEHATLCLHRVHARVLTQSGWPSGAEGSGGPRLRPFADGFDLEPGVHIRPMLAAHDAEGTTAFRIDLPGFGGGTLGFATDLGRVTLDLVEHFRADHGNGAGVDVLAIESNYCPKLQLASDRPVFLKQRIMGGRGHLSNQEAFEAIQAIQPREHVVLLHLSRQCNDPSVVAGLHEGADYAWTITSQFAPSRWVRLAPSARATALPVVSARLRQTAVLWNDPGEHSGRIPSTA